MFSVHIIVSFLPFFDGELRSSTATVSAGFPFRDVFVCYERVPCREKFLSFFASSSSLLSLLTTLHVALALSLLSPLWLSGLPTANSVLCPSGVLYSCVPIAICCSQLCRVPASSPKLSPRSRLVSTRACLVFICHPGWLRRALFWNLEASVGCSPSCISSPLVYLYSCDPVEPFSDSSVFVHSLVLASPISVHGTLWLSWVHLNLIIFPLVLDILHSHSGSVLDSSGSDCLSERSVPAVSCLAPLPFSLPLRSAFRPRISEADSICYFQPCRQLAPPCGPVRKTCLLAGLSRCRPRVANDGPNAGPALLQRATIRSRLRRRAARPATVRPLERGLPLQ